MLALVYSIINSSTDGWTNARTVGGFALAAVLIAGFLTIESKSAAPLLPLRLFKIRSLVAGSLGEFLTTSLMFPMFFLVSLYMQEVLGYSPLKAGLAWAPGAVLFLLLAPLIQGAIQKVGPRAVYLAGTVVWAITVVFLLIGLAMVLCLIVNPIVGTSKATAQDAGITSAAINVFTQVGGAIGVSVAVTIFYSRSNHLTAHGHSAASSMVGGLHAAGIALIVLLALHMVNGLITYRGLRGAKAA
jgi:hypothetical protein